MRIGVLWRILRRVRGYEVRGQRTQTTIESSMSEYCERRDGRADESLRCRRLRGGIMSRGRGGVREGV